MSGRKTVGQKAYIEAIEKYRYRLRHRAGRYRQDLSGSCRGSCRTEEQSYYNRIILVRPAVEAGESLGFLPGDIRAKVDPYLRPVYDALHDMLPADKIKKLMELGVIEIVPLAFMRGRTLNNSFVILDEAQNTTVPQMKMFLTRIGEGSKAVITGDVTQIDLDRKRLSGLIAIQKILRNIPEIKFCYLTRQGCRATSAGQRILFARLSVTKRGDGSRCTNCYAISRGRSDGGSASTARVDWSRTNRATTDSGWDVVVIFAILFSSFLFPMAQLFAPISTPDVGEVATEDVIAPFDFPVYKSQAELDNETRSSAGGIAGGTVIQSEDMVDTRSSVDRSIVLSDR